MKNRTLQEHIIILLFLIFVALFLFLLGTDSLFYIFLSGISISVYPYLILNFFTSIIYWNKVFSKSKPLARNLFERFFILLLFFIILFLILQRFEEYNTIIEVIIIFILLSTFNNIFLLFIYRKLIK
ncbi:hypothetical protein BPO_1112 [Bergeyella porcorum]|uniref:Uncharacterized protein n=1 Tax=Bergeyella porcorum TaxID=1735111 RepID=A0AAU0F1E4_9FLAO